MIVWIILSLILPLLIAWLDYTVGGENKIILLKDSVLTLVTAGAIMLLAAFLLKSRVTGAEYLLLNALSAILVKTIVLYWIEHKTLSKLQCLKASAMAAMAVGAYSIMTYGQTNLNSDTATATLLARSILESRSLFPSTWNYANGEIWFLNNSLFCLLPSSLLKDQSLARMIGSFTFVLVAILGVMLQSEKFFRAKSWLIAVPIIMVFLFGMEEFSLFQTAYTGQLLWIALGSTFLFAVYADGSRRQRGWNLLFYGVLMTLLTMSGVRALAEQTVPALGTCFLMLCLKYADEQSDFRVLAKKALFLFAGILLPAVLGLIIYKWLCSWHIMNVTSLSTTGFSASLETIWHNIGLTIIDFFSCFGYVGNVELLTVPGIRNFVSVIMCVLICLVVPVLQGRVLKKEPDEIRFFFFFTVIHNLIMILLAVFFDKNEPRYLLTSVYCFVLLSSRYIYVYWIGQKNFRQYVWTGLFVLATAVECLGVLAECAGWTTALAQQEALSRELESRGLTKGYATYWNAYSNEVYSDLKIRFGAVTLEENGFACMYWLVDDSAFTPAAGKETFLLLSQEEEESLTGSVSDYLGEPTETFSFDNMIVYVFDHDIAGDLINALRDGVVLPYEMRLTKDGGTVGRERLKILPGGISFGPYGTLQEGEYLISFDGANLDEGLYEIDSLTKSNLIRWEELERTEDTILVKLSLSGLTDNVEFRIINNTEEPIELYKITAEPFAAQG